MPCPLLPMSHLLFIRLCVCVRVRVCARMSMSVHMYKNVWEIRGQFVGISFLPPLTDWGSNPLSPVSFILIQTLFLFDASKYTSFFSTFLALCHLFPRILLIFFSVFWSLDRTRSFLTFLVLIHSCLKERCYLVRISK